MSTLQDPVIHVDKHCGSFRALSFCSLCTFCTFPVRLSSNLTLVIGLRARRSNGEEPDGSICSLTEKKPLSFPNKGEHKFFVGRKVTSAGSEHLFRRKWGLKLFCSASSSSRGYKSLPQSNVGGDSQHEPQGPRAVHVSSGPQCSYLCCLPTCSFTSVPLR